MGATSAYAVHATGVAMLEDEDVAVERLVELADGVPERLYEAHELLPTLAGDRDRRVRAGRLIVRALRRIEGASR